MSGPVTSVARVEDVQIFLKDPVYMRDLISYECLHDQLQWFSSLHKTESEREHSHGRYIFSLYSAEILPKKVRLP